MKPYIEWKGKGVTSMKRLSGVLSFLFAVVVVCGSVGTLSAKTERDLAPDQLGDDDVLNEELWQYSKKTPYSQAMEHIARRAQEPKPTSPAQITLPSGWRISPAGTQVEVGRFPHEAVPYAGQIVVLNTGFYTKEPQEISVVNPPSGQLFKVLRLESMFPSAAPALDGDLYISGGFSRKITRFNSKFEAVREYPVNGYSAGLAPMDKGRMALVTLVSSENQTDFESGKYAQGKIAILNTVSGEIEKEVVAGYFPHTVRFLNGKLYVSVLGENKVRVYSGQLDLLKTLETGRAPQDLCPDGERLYVVNTSSDSLSVIDTRKDSVVAVFEMKVRGNQFGSGPTSCAVGGNKLYVTQSYVNAVAVLDKKTGKLLGSIPTGWYPTKVIVQKERLLVLSAKGIRPRRPNVDGPQPYPEKGGSQYVLSLLKGSLSIIPRKLLGSRLPVWTRQVVEGSPMHGLSRAFKLPIRHIFYIVRENRTYDQVLGDLGRGDGDPYLTLFGEEVTPNAHRLAREFVTLDNYYANGEISVLGHSFTTSGYASPFLEWIANARYSGRYSGYPFGSVPAVTSPTYLWDALDEKGVDYRIYGENYFLYTRAYRLIVERFGQDSPLAGKFYANMMSHATKVDRGKELYTEASQYYGQTQTPADALRLLEQPDFALKLSKFLCGDDSLAIAMKDDVPLKKGFAEYLTRYPFNYRSWDLHTSDLDRARTWKIDFQDQIQRNKVAQLHYIWLPNDHTGGTDKKYPTPDELIAQNDAALGFIIETISRSPVWKESLILVTEDDAQNGPDHVDATRTVALAAGPYVKRNAVIHDRYDQLSMLRTMECLLGLLPLNMNDALAVPMFTLFSRTPDFRPYQATEPSKKMMEADHQLYRQLK